VPDLRVIGIAGSLRERSYNRKLLREAIRRGRRVGLAIETAEVGDFPLYDGDLEVSAFPEVVTSLKKRIQAADGLLLVTPEYNYGVPGMLKNAVDWLSRPYPDPTLRKTPAGVMGASTGWAGTVRAQLAWRQAWTFLKAPMFGEVELHVSAAADAFDAEGRLVREPLSTTLDQYLAAFAAWLERGCAPLPR
jgi:chromate reductase